MTIDPQKPPRNRDQELPPRKGETIESVEPTRDDKRRKQKPLPEEETYEREQPSREQTLESSH